MKNYNRISKIKRMRTWANWNMIIGIFCMYAGYFLVKGNVVSWLNNNYLFMAILLIIGFILMIISTVLFMISGMVSTSAPQAECPSCKKVTKMMGKQDACMFCGQPLELSDASPTSTIDAK
ncbi:DUF2614 family zinc ribbon-containing protein [Brevibacillus ginsengisoli]|uniref:DUF2614 family zinc ribbon-containing protein n=1 Tax=Brevibacillus ginsengisoli TaxID=363854 RepID=UPI003CF89770